MDYITTLFKTGNGYALRIPKGVVEASGLQPGAKVVGPELKSAPDTELTEEKRLKVIAAFKELQRIVAEDPNSGLAQIKDAGAWQREVRKDRPLLGRD